MKSLQLQYVKSATVILLLLTPVQLYAGHGMGPGPGLPVSSGGGSADILAESFDSSGFDDAGWGSASGDPDSTNTPPIGETGFSSQCIRWSTNWGSSYDIWDDGSSNNEVWITHHYYLDSESLTNGGTAMIIGAIRDTSDNVEARWEVYKTGDNLYIRLYTEAGTIQSSNTISLDTAFEIRVNYDSVNDTVDWSVDGTAQTQATSINGNSMHSIQIGHVNGNNVGPAVSYYDDLQIDSTGYK